VHFLIRANASIRYTVDAVNPYNTSQVYTAEKILTMSQHYFFVHTLPWISKYFAPEVAVVNVDLATHRGLGYFYGNVIARSALQYLDQQAAERIGVHSSIQRVFR